MSNVKGTFMCIVLTMTNRHPEQKYEGIVARIQEKSAMQLVAKTTRTVAKESCRGVVCLWSSRAVRILMEMMLLKTCCYKQEKTDWYTSIQLCHQYMIVE